MKLKPAYVYLAVGVALILGWFYWYEYRPSELRRLCAMNLIAEQYAQRDKTFDVKHWTQICVEAGGAENFYDAFQKGMAQRRPPEEALPAESEVE